MPGVTVCLTNRRTVCKSKTNRKPTIIYFSDLLSLTQEVGSPYDPHSPLDSTAYSGHRKHVAEQVIFKNMTLLNNILIILFPSSCFNHSLF